MSYGGGYGHRQTSRNRHGHPFHRAMSMAMQPGFDDAFFNDFMSTGMPSSLINEDFFGNSSFFSSAPFSSMHSHHQSHRPPHASLAGNANEAQSNSGAVIEEIGNDDQNQPESHTRMRVEEPDLDNEHTNNDECHQRVRRHSSSRAAVSNSNRRRRNVNPPLSGMHSMSSFSSSSYSSNGGNAPIMQFQSISRSTDGSGATVERRTFRDGVSRQERQAVRRSAHGQSHEVHRERVGDAPERVFENFSNLNPENMDEFNLNFNRYSSSRGIDSRRNHRRQIRQ